MAVINSAHVDPSFFEQGRQDRAAWEQWFDGLQGDYKTGAFFWAGQRSLPKPGPCKQMNDDFYAGCTAAKVRLSASDTLRKTQPDYKAGWNAWTPGELTTPPAAGQQAVRPNPVSNPWVLIRQEREANETCRGGYPDDPQTASACTARDNYAHQLYALGWCFGKQNQFEYEKRWDKCESDSQAGSPIEPSLPALEWEERLREQLEVSPARLSPSQRDCLAKESVFVFKNNPDPISACKIPQSLYAPAISLVGAFNNRGELLARAH